MKIWRIVLLGILWLSLFGGSGVLAQGDTAYEDALSQSGALELEESLPDEVAERLEDWGVSPENRADSFPDALTLLKHWVALAATALSAPMAAGGAALTAVAVCGVFGIFRREGASHWDTLSGYFGILCIGSICLLPLMESVRSMGEAVSVCSGFMMAFVPVYAGILLAGGSSAALGSQSLIFGAAQLFARLADSVLLPAAGGLVAGSVVSGLFGELRLDGFLRGFQKLVHWILGIGMALFSALLTVTGAVHASADSMALRTTKLMTASLVPVVGGAVSEALSSVMTCVGTLRSGVGAYGLFGVGAVLLPVLCQLLMWRLMLMLVASAADLFGVEGMSRLLGGVGSAVSVLLALVVSVAVVFVVSVGILMMMGPKL